MSPSGPTLECQGTCRQARSLGMAGQEDSASEAPSRGREKKKLKNLPKFSGFS